MADTHACVQCKKNRLGRFTRLASGASGAWTKNSLPAWHCFTCLPKGKGRGESVEEPVTVTPGTKTISVISPKTLVTEKVQGTALITPLQAEVKDLPAIIKTPEEYEAADAILGHVIKARKTWKLKMYGTPTAPGPIPSIKSGLDQLYALNREVDVPLGNMEDNIKGRMKAFKAVELRAIQEKEWQRQQEEAAAAEALEAAARKEAAAKTPAQKARAAEDMEEAEQAYIETQTVAETPVQVTNSGVRVPKKPTVSDVLAFCKGIADGEIPVECIELRQGTLNKLYKDDPETVAAFPGVTIIDDIQIVGRG